MHEMTTSWNYGLVALSLITAIIGSYVALYFAGKLRTSERDQQRLLWTILGASTMGLAIWSMHFVGMLAMTMPMPMSYDPWLSWLSMMAAIAGAGIAFLILQRPAMARTHYIFGSLAMGLAIATMHYTGMASMQMAASIIYNPILFCLSILIAIFASMGALWLAFRPITGTAMSIMVQKLGSAVVMGLAISGMHYTGMLAAHYIHMGALSGQEVEQTVGGMYLGDILIIALAFFALALVVLSTQVYAEKQSIIQELSESEQRFLATFEQAAVGIAQVSPSGTWLRLNQKYCDILGYRQEELLGKDFQDLLYPDESTDDLGRYQELIAGHIDNYSMEKRYFRSTGSVVWVYLVVSIVRDKSGRPLYSIVVAEEITQRKQAEEDLQQSQSMLKDYNVKLAQSNRDLDQFATITSHDLQAPLRKVMMFSESLKQSAMDKLDVDEIDYIERMQKAALHMQGLINDLLTLSRITRKGNPFQPTNLNDVIADVLDTLEAPLIETHGRVEVLNDLPTIDADERQLQQIFMNLIGNALKFHKSNQNPVVTISSEVYGGLCHILVQDNGIGFKPEHSERIFRIFERVHDSTQYSGTGIGLSIVQRIIERHHGHITASSTPGHGATFTLSLPVKQFESQQKAKDELTPTISVGDK